MKRIIFILVLTFFIWAGIVQAGTLGRILLQVEDNGEAWYVNPETSRRYFLGRPEDAWSVMRLSGVGITNSDLNKIPAAFGYLGSFGYQDSDQDGYSNLLELEHGFDPHGPGYIAIDESFAGQQAGKIFLQVEENGEAWYVSPVNNKRYFLGRPADAFAIMRELGLGITNTDLAKIEEGDIYNIGEERKEIPSRAGDSLILHDVPFSPQAPFGNWADDRQEDGCEEVSSLMAVRWARGQGLTREEALDELIAIAAYENNNYGNYHDTSARDTAERIIKGYLDYYNIEYKENIDKDDIINVLAAGNVVIVPINGMAVGNPYYTQPGPPRHMLVIKGYDRVRDIFITNDPGTRRGEGYEYPADTLFGAIRDYPTGYHPEVSGNKKAMIIVMKQGT